MPSQIQAGDVVVLKSGGPEMTVKWVSGTECYCEWFDGFAQEIRRVLSRSVSPPGVQTQRKPVTPGISPACLRAS